MFPVRTHFFAALRDSADSSSRFLFARRCVPSCSQRQVISTCTYLSTIYPVKFQHQWSHNAQGWRRRSLQQLTFFLHSFSARLSLPTLSSSVTRFS